MADETPNTDEAIAALPDKIAELAPGQQATVVAVVDRLTEGTGTGTAPLTADEVAQHYDALDERAQRRLSRQIQREAARVARRP